MRRRAVILVLDGVGIGAAPDADTYGDVGSDTLGNLARARRGLSLPALQAAGLGNIAAIAGVPPSDSPHAAWGLMRPASPGKDSTTGHWEIAGLHLRRPFPTYPSGFPAEVLERFSAATGRAVLGNVAASGTEIIARHGDEHGRTGAWIVYTSADSVFQVAAHESVVPLHELYAACELARAQLVAPHDVSRVIARPFTGTPGTYERTGNRRDYSIVPPGETLLDALSAAGVPRAGVGKVDDLFAGRGLRSRHTADNAEGIRLVQEWLAGEQGGLLFVNLVDFDTLYGHRGDAAGFERALREFDDALPALRAALREDDLLFITADHGNDPTTGSTDHARENVPLLAFGDAVRPVALGERATFSDLGATVAEWLNVSFRGHGASFLPRLERGA
ncbi:MAG: phosphopentomutase [Gemmatimonadetes bacterium]|jgi:phosphopentomutase|nr:phosphopentomutase [Gemmatimonadota bacterium]